MGVNFDEYYDTTNVPKDVDLAKLIHWRPIALLPFFYKIFSKFVYNRSSTLLFNYQSWDQHGILGIRIEDALLYAEVVLEHHQEFNLSMWML